MLHLLIVYIFVQWLQTILLLLVIAGDVVAQLSECQAATIVVLGSLRHIVSWNRQHWRLKRQRDVFVVFCQLEVS
jgi:hypothetical protein